MTSIIDFIPGLKRISTGRRGIEYHGACPWNCGADQNGFHVWIACPDGRRDNYWCRSCGRTGDDIQYLRDHDGLSYVDACRALGCTPAALSFRPSAPVVPDAPALEVAPNARWQATGKAFVNHCVDALWQPEHRRALDYLRKRGLTDRTIELAGLGWNARSLSKRPADKWGLTADDAPNGVWLPRGWVIPVRYGRDLWRIAIRRPNADIAQDDKPMKYPLVRGSANIPYGMDHLSPRLPVVIVEGYFDMLIVNQECAWRDDADAIATAVAVGTTHGRRLQWVLPIGQSPCHLIALDNEPENVGVQRGAAWWRDMFEPRSLAWPPTHKDCAEMYEQGVDLRSWVVDGLRAAQAASVQVAA